MKRGFREKLLLTAKISSSRNPSLSAAWLTRHEMLDGSAVDVSIGAQEWIYVWHSGSASLPLVRAHFERLRTDMVATPYVTAGE